MQISVTDAKGQRTELVRRAEAGDEVILTRHGHAAVRLVAVKTLPDRESRKELLKAVRASAAAKMVPGPSAARSQDFLYSEWSAWVIAVDTSALMAILLNEPPADACSAVLEAEDRLLISAGTVADALIVATRRNIGPKWPN